MISTFLHSLSYRLRRQPYGDGFNRPAAFQVQDVGGDIAQAFDMRLEIGGIGFNEAGKLNGNRVHRVGVFKRRTHLGLGQSPKFLWFVLNCTFRTPSDGDPGILPAACFARTAHPNRARLSSHERRYVTPLCLRSLIWGSCYRPSKPTKSNICLS